jgi:hypothetical protein
MEAKSAEAVLPSSTSPWLRSALNRQTAKLPVNNVGQNLI